MDFVPLSHVPVHSRSSERLEPQLGFPIPVLRHARGCRWDSLSLAVRVPALFRGEQAHALSIGEDGHTQYEIRAALGRLLGYLVDIFGGLSPEQCNTAMADARKERSEAQTRMSE